MAGGMEAMVVMVVTVDTEVAMDIDTTDIIIADITDIMDKVYDDMTPSRLLKYLLRFNFN